MDEIILDMSSVYVRDKIFILLSCVEILGSWEYIISKITNNHTILINNNGEEVFMDFALYR